MPSLLYILLVVVVVLPLPVSSQHVRPVDLDSLSPSDFSNDELDLPYYLQHFSAIANSVMMEGPDRGFIDISVWREPRYNEPNNPRIMENVLSLAFFYVTDRSWNPYFEHPAVRERLEAALEFWIGQQDDQGLYTHRVNSNWSLSPTAFTTKFLGETLRLLSTGPPISGSVLQNAFEVQRKALRAVLTREDLYAFAVRFTNQYTNVWGGTAAYLTLRADPQIERLFDARLRNAPEDLQSPAGYFYEHDGPDWVYDLETHHSNHRMAWHYLRGTELGDIYADMVRRWYDWLAYNAVLEPDGSGFAMNHSLETRQSFPFFRDNRENMYDETCTPLAEVVIEARAFCESVEEREARLALRRTELERSWPVVPPLDIGTFSAYSPYVFLHRNHIKWHPTSDQKSGVRQRLPPVAPGAFTHQRADDRHPLIATYIRRPTYYAAFTTGEQLSSRQRYGLGLVASARAGAVLQSQSDSEGTWGTRSSDGDAIYETAIPDPLIEIDGEIIKVKPQPREFPPGTLSISYLLGSRGEKTVTFLDDAIDVDIRHSGSIRESLPLTVRPDDHINLTDTSIDISMDGFSWSVTFDGNASAALTEGDERVGHKSVVTVRLEAQDSLRYQLRFPAAE